MDEKRVGEERGGSIGGQSSRGRVLLLCFVRVRCTEPSEMISLTRVVVGEHIFGHPAATMVSGPPFQPSLLPGSPYHDQNS